MGLLPIRCSLLAFITLCIHENGYVDAFAAKKKSGGGKANKKKKNASTIKGFGAAPPTFEEVLAKFPTRMPAKTEAPSLTCPCGSGKTYGDCCQPFHDKSQPCTTMTDVLRSRYTAFSWRLIDYIIETTHPTCRDWREDKIDWAKDLNKQGMFDSFDFVQLEAGEEEAGENENEGFLDFQVTLRGKVDAHNGAAVAGKETIIRERSKFIRDPESGVWSYSSGDVRSEVAGLEDTQLNA